MVLTNGPPSQSIQPFKFGQVDQITFTQAQSLQMMLQQATGAVDGASMAQNPGLPRHQRRGQHEPRRGDEEAAPYPCQLSGQLPAALY